MADDVYATSSSFQAYKCYPTDGVDTFAITNGYRVRMTGHLQKYYTLSTSTYTVEMKLVPATIIAEQQVADTLTIAEALAIGAELPAGGFTPVKYVIRGYVSHIDTPFEESTGFETFYIADDIIGIGYLFLIPVPVAYHILVGSVLGVGFEGHNLSRRCAAISVVSPCFRVDEPIFETHLLDIFHPRIIKRVAEAFHIGLLCILGACFVIDCDISLVEGSRRIKVEVAGGSGNGDCRYG